jgi:hypothetical protein
VPSVTTGLGSWVIFVRGEGLGGGVGPEGVVPVSVVVGVVPVAGVVSPVGPVTAAAVAVGGMPTAPASALARASVTRWARRVRARELTGVKGSRGCGGLWRTGAWACGVALKADVE